MRLPTPLTALALAVAMLAPALPASSATVSNLTAFSRNGQTFLTWTALPGTGWTYMLYSSDHALTPLDGIVPGVRYVGSVGDSTWCDRRLSKLTGVTYGFCVDSAAAPLPSDAGLFVVTPVYSGAPYYTVVAAQGTGFPDRTIVPGQNALTSPVVEVVQAPRPVYQRTLTVAARSVEIYTLWTTNAQTPYFPTTSNVPSLAFDCGVVRGGVAPTNALLIRPHQRQGSFFDVLGGSGMPGEWVLALDDPLFNRDVNSFFYGYHEQYDVFSDFNTAPITGKVRDYTLKRIQYTIEWARQNFPIDVNRCYAMGYSMGGIGSMLLGFSRPDLVAGVLAIVSKVDFSFLTDPIAESGFNTGNVLRDVSDRLWGTVSTNLPSNDGMPVFDRLDDSFLAGWGVIGGIPPIIAFNGKNDTTVGWAEKIPFYQSMAQHRQGGYFFWDPRDHLGSATAAWTPMQSTRYLYRFRLDRSFPALSACSVNGNPGDGTPTSGDSVGTINGYVEWDTTFVDQSTVWETTLWTRALTTRWGVDPGPDSVTVDVTPRRLQTFLTIPGLPVRYTVTRVSDGAVVQSGTLIADASNLVTVPGTKVYRGGSRLRLERDAATGVPGTGLSSGARPLVTLGANPVSESTTLRVQWPGTGDARVDLVDIAGRRVRTVASAGAARGTTVHPLDAAGSTGVFFLVARQGAAVSTTRVVFLR